MQLPFAATRNDGKHGGPGKPRPMLSAEHPPTPCLDEDEVLAFTQGGVLSSEQQTRIDTHVDSCEQCFALVTQFAHTSSPALDFDSDDVELVVRAMATMFQPGAVLAGRYRIVRFIARGGMGEVYEATDRILGESVAMKTVISSSAGCASAVRKLFDEVQLARRVQHPHVCRIHELHEHRTVEGELVHFLTMEFIRGERLAERLRRSGPLPVATAVSLARQILSGLQAAHSAHVLHLDLKTDNIMLRGDDAGEPDAVIMDFGLSRAFDEELRLRTSEQRQLVGSLAYMSPEQVECRPTLGPESDIYSFGVVLFELLTGRLPFAGDTPLAVMMSRLKQRPQVPSKLRPGLPPGLDGFVLRCLSREVQDRYRDVASALVGLERAVAGPSPRRSGVARLGGAAAAVVGAGALAVLAAATVGSSGAHGTHASDERVADAPEAAAPAAARQRTEVSVPHTEPTPASDGARVPAEPVAEPAAKVAPPPAGASTRPSVEPPGRSTPPPQRRAASLPATSSGAARRPLPGAPKGLSW